MKPGRELDALIAEKIMGWTKQPKTRFRTWKAEVTGYESELWIAPGETLTQVYRADREYPPSYSTNIEDAWRVVNQLAERGYLITLEYPPYYGWQCGFTPGDGTGRNFFAEAATAPHAICLAALEIEK